MTVTTTVTMFTLRKNAGTSYVTLEACIEHEALFTCEQGRHGHCRFCAFLVCTISTVISNLLSFVLAAPTRTASSTREPSSSPQHQLHPNGSSFIFAFISFLSSSSSSIRSSPLHSYTRLTACNRIYSIHSINLSFSVSYSPWSSRRCPFSLSCSRSPFPTSLFLHHRSPLALLPPSLSHSHAAGRSDTSAAPELCDACQSSR